MCKNVVAVAYVSAVAQTQCLNTYTMANHNTVHILVATLVKYCSICLLYIAMDSCIRSWIFPPKPMLRKITLILYQSTTVACVNACENASPAHVTGSISMIHSIVTFNDIVILICLQDSDAPLYFLNRNFRPIALGYSHKSEQWKEHKARRGVGVFRGHLVWR